MSCITTTDPRALKNWMISKGLAMPSLYDLEMRLVELEQKNAELEQKNASMEKRNEQVKKYAEFTMMAGVLMEHCWHLGISDDVVEDSFKEEFMKYGYKGVYDALVQLNEPCGCEECMFIEEDFKP